MKISKSIKTHDSFILFSILDPLRISSENGWQTRTDEERIVRNRENMHSTLHYICIVANRDTIL
jgi:hypothetical protein